MAKVCSRALREKCHMRRLELPFSRALYMFSRPITSKLDLNRTKKCVYKIKCWNVRAKSAAFLAQQVSCRNLVHHGLLKLQWACELCLWVRLTMRDPGAGKSCGCMHRQKCQRYELGKFLFWHRKWALKHFTQHMSGCLKLRQAHAKADVLLSNNEFARLEQNLWVRAQVNAECRNWKRCCSGTVSMP